jgi:hypothetical protein
MKWTVLIALLSWSSPALAMNWEGHDDWMEDHPAAVALEQEADESRPLPPTPCAERQSGADNPYEQVALRENPCTVPIAPSAPQR